MAARSKARKRALDVLFEAEVRGDPVLALLTERITFGGTDQGGPPVPEYAAELVRGVTAHQERIDELIAEYAEGWSLERMPAVDRNVLRLGVYEIFWADNVPDGVAISEAVQLVGDLSTDASSGFVNGILARLADLKPTITLYPDPPSPPEPPTTEEPPPSSEAVAPDPAAPSSEAVAPDPAAPSSEAVAPDPER